MLLSSMGRALKLSPNNTISTNAIGEPMKRIAAILLLLLVTSILDIFGQDRYFVEFIDKTGTEHTLQNPSTYLSPKSIERRRRQSIGINEIDLPVSEAYVRHIRQLGVEVVFTSKWLNGAVIKNATSKQIRQLQKKEWIKNVLLIYDSKVKGTPTPDFTTYTAYRAANDSSNFYNYGPAMEQVAMVNGQDLHNLGFRGKGMTIAVLDGGFYKANILPVFDSLWTNQRVVFEKDVVDPESNLYQQNSHGMFVLSVLGANVNGLMVGTAPEADYALIRCEDTYSEQVIEEYYWAKAAELADSLGVDIINSSLGYYEYDAPWQSLSYNQLDGKTTPIARAASIAAQLGMLVVVSAGNEAITDWRHIISPADAHNCIAVGAVNAKGKVSSFSSIGPTSDGRIKPDVVALGENTVVQTTEGEIGTADGTSLAAPIVSGFAACLWQALPHLTAKEISEIIIQSASQHNAPNNRLGHGVPNFLKALEASKQEKGFKP